MSRCTPTFTLFPYTTLFRSVVPQGRGVEGEQPQTRHTQVVQVGQLLREAGEVADAVAVAVVKRSEEHTSELQSPCKLVCRLLLEKKKKTYANRDLCKYNEGA